MALELVKFSTVKEAFNSTASPNLEQRLNPFTFAQNMDARIENPVLEDSTLLWGTWLDSRTMQLYGGRSKKYDDRYVFKIDHELDLGIIINGEVNFNGAIPIDESVYTSSAGTEFVMIKSEDINGTGEDFAIRADKYGAVSQQFGKGMDINALVKAGGFKVNQNLMPDEVIIYDKTKDIDALTFKNVSYVNDGWLELAVGKNKATEQDYQSAIVRLAKYTKKAEEMKCFGDNGKGMSFFIETENENFEVCPWCVGLSGDRSGAIDGAFFRYDGRFLRVRSDKVAEGDVSKDTPTSISIIDYEGLWKPIFGGSAEELRQAVESLDPKRLSDLANAVNIRYVMMQESKAKK